MKKNLLTPTEIKILLAYNKKINLIDMQDKFCLNLRIIDKIAREAVYKLAEHVYNEFHCPRVDYTKSQKKYSQYVKKYFKQFD